MSRASKIALGLTGVVVIAVALLFSSLRNGFSTLDEPSSVEAIVAGFIRRGAVPSELRNAGNPLPLTPESLAEGRAHFADHCAGCHGNDGKGKTSMGQRFYPRVPDMTKPGTQEQTDGALFATIENGIRLTAMPAFGEGTAESAYGTWTLVHFIRHLPKITPEELAEMQRLNPKSPAEWQQMQRMRQASAAGDGAGAVVPVAHDAQPHHH